MTVVISIYWACVGHYARSFHSVFLFPATVQSGRCYCQWENRSPRGTVPCPKSASWWGQACSSIWKIYRKNQIKLCRLDNFWAISFEAFDNRMEKIYNFFYLLVLEMPWSEKKWLLKVTERYRVQTHSYRLLNLVAAMLALRQGLSVLFLLFWIQGKSPFFWVKG